MARVNRRKLKLADVTFTLEVSPEDMPVDGMFDDAETAEDIKRAVANGSELAWCCLLMKATWAAPDGTVHEGIDSLGGCSFLSDGSHGGRKRQLDECVESHGMREQALEDLQRAVNDHDRRELAGMVTEHVQALSDATLRNWVKRGFPTVAPLARLELARRAIK